MEVRQKQSCFIVLCCLSLLNVPIYFNVHAFDINIFNFYDSVHIINTPKIIQLKGGIEKNIWQTWFNHEMLPHHEKMRDLNPSYNYHLLNDSEVYHFMKYELNQNLWSNVSRAFFMINAVMGAVRTDVFRFAILWQYGGVYVDYDSCCNRAFDAWIGPNDTAYISATANKVRIRFNTSRSNTNSTNATNELEIIDTYRQSQWVLVFQSKHPFITKQLEIITQRIFHFEGKTLLQIKNELKKRQLVPQSYRISVNDIVAYITGATAYSEAIHLVINSNKYNPTNLYKRMPNEQWGGKCTPKCIQNSQNVYKTKHWPLYSQNDFILISNSNSTI